jgi:prolyl-tRNA synthetase
VTVVRRITGERAVVPLSAAATYVSDALAADQATLLAEATRRRDERTVTVSTVADAAAAAATGWARIPWALLGEQGEAELAEGGVTVRCLTRPDDLAPDTADEPDLIAVVARAY